MTMREVKLMKGNESNLRNQLIVKILIISGIGFLIGCVFAENVFWWAKGIAFGAVFSSLKLVLMEKTFQKVVIKEPNQAKRAAEINYFARYLLTGLVLLISALEPTINIIGTIIGLLAMKFAALWQGIATPPTPRDGSVEFIKYDIVDDKESDF